MSVSSITSISGLAPTTSRAAAATKSLLPAAAQPAPKTVAQPATQAAPKSAAQPAGQAAPASAPPPAAAPSGGTAAVASASAALISSSYSTTVGGKSYSGSISQSNGTYTVSVPNLPGASVSGSSLQAAENALTVRIDTLV
jgi:hypothetical protein